LLVVQEGTAVQFRDDDALKVDGFTADEQDQSLNCSLTKAEHPSEHATIGSPAVISISQIDAESNELLGTCAQDAETNEKDQDQSQGNVQTDHVNQGTCDSLQSMDVDLPQDRNKTRREAKQHLTRHIIQAMLAMNMLMLCRCQHYRTDMGIKIATGVPNKGRDAYDAAGKFVLSLKLLSLGVKESQFIIDAAQAGGACGTADAFIPGSGEYVEIKGARAKSRGSRVQGLNARPQFQICRIRNSWWGKLSLVCRERDPNDWTNVAEYDQCGFWLGLIKRSRYEEVRAAAGKGVAREVQVAVSPVTDGMRVQRHGGWLSQHVTWIRFQDLTLKWCEDHLF
jgi:hypothetical protein